MEQPAAGQPDSSLTAFATSLDWQGADAPPPSGGSPHRVVSRRAHDPRHLAASAALTIVAFALVSLVAVVVYFASASKSNRQAATQWQAKASELSTCSADARASSTTSR